MGHEEKKEVDREMLAPAREAANMVERLCFSSSLKLVSSFIFNVASGSTTFMALLRQSGAKWKCGGALTKKKPHEYPRQGTAIAGDVGAHPKIVQPCRHA